MISEMKPKQRVLKALSHQRPDHTPCDYMGTSETNEKLKKHFQTDDMDVVLEKLGVDLRVIEPLYVGPKLRSWDDGRFEDLWGPIFKPIKNEAGVYNESIEFPYAEFQSISDVEKYRWPTDGWFDCSSIPEQCKKYADYAIVYGSPGNMDLINGTAFGMGVEKVLLGIGLDDPIIYACMKKRFQCCYEISEKVLQAADGKIDIFWIGDDYGTQNGLLVSPEKWRKLFFPKLKMICELGHKYGAKVMLHSCGGTRPLWPELIEAGVDIYQTVQPEAVDMEPGSLKEEFGERICFHGTVSTQKTLPFGTPEDVVVEVRERIETVGAGGGLIVASAHNMQPDTPVENILAMYEAVRSN